MSSGTGIEWTDATWNPVRGCWPVSPGCANCYAARQAIRHAGPGRPYEGLAVSTPGGPKWTGTARVAPSALTWPLRWRGPGDWPRIFVNSMSDLFHEDLTDEEVALIFGVMAIACRHTFQVLTKRPDRMLAFFRRVSLLDCIGLAADCESIPRPSQWHRPADFASRRLFYTSSNRERWPLPNVWLGVSVESQHYANERIPVLLESPAALHFISYEPALGPVDLGLWLARVDRPRWVIAGGESGPGARLCRLGWLGDVVQQAAAFAVPCFVKQLGAAPVHDRFGRIPLRDRKGGDVDEWPFALRVRRFPAGGSWWWS